MSKRAKVFTGYTPGMVLRSTGGVVYVVQADSSFRRVVGYSGEATPLPREYTVPTPERSRRWR